MNTATTNGTDLATFRGHARLYEMNPPYDGHRYVIVSTNNVLFTGVETYIFPANKDGTIKNWNELDGSERGVDNHQDVIESIGYQIITNEEQPA